MFDWLRNKGKMKLKEDIVNEILGELDASEAESNRMNLANERLINRILMSNDPTDLQKQISLFNLKKDFQNRLRSSDNMKIRRMNEKRIKGEVEEGEEEEPNGEGQGVPTLDVAGQSEAIASAINKIPLKYRIIADTILKSTTGHGLDDIKKNPALAIEMADKFKGLIPQIQAKKKEGTTYKSSSGQEVDITDSQGYALQ